MGENGFNTTLKLQEDFKFCCSTIELVLDSSLLEDKWKNLPGIYRVDYTTASLRYWIYKHDDHHYVIRRKDDGWYIGTSESDRGLKFKGNPKTCVTDVLEFKQWDYRNKNRQGMDLEA